MVRCDLHCPGDPRGSTPWYNRWFLVVATANLVGATISVIDDKPSGFSDDLISAGVTTEGPHAIQEIAVNSSEPNATPSASDRMLAPVVQSKFREHRAVQPVEYIRRLAAESQNKMAQWFQSKFREHRAVQPVEYIRRLAAESQNKKAHWFQISIEDKKVGKNISRSTSRFRVLCLSLPVIATISSLWLMMPAGPHGQNNHRYPPRWEPGLEGSLPFRTWLQDLLLWTITTDLEPHRQAAAIIAQLGGAARELARTLSPQEIFNGGVVNGQHLDPVSFLIHGLSERFSPLDDEIRVRAAQDLLQFNRRGNESVDVLVSRFETIRARARAEGGWCEHQHRECSVDPSSCSRCDIRAISEADSAIWTSSSEHRAGILPAPAWT